MLNYNLKTLPNGVRIISESIPWLSSASLGIWVGTGSRDEKASENGAAHFIEHMLFKGTEQYSASEIAARMDTIGGQINAFTSKECTCFYGKALSTHLHEALDILCDMFFNSKFDEHDVQTERGVVLEEIGMYQDDPSDVVFERLNSAVYKGSSLARPILGKKSTLDKMTGKWLKNYKNKHYTTSKIIIAVAGNFDYTLLDEIESRFSQMQPVESMVLQPAVYNPAFTIKKKSTEQNHIVLAFPGLRADDQLNFTLRLVCSILGGGMSSRLFQEIREKRGLCYTIYVTSSSYLDTGNVTVYTALSKETQMEALKATREIIDDFVLNGVPQDELNRVREMTKSSVLMGMESNVSHMNYIARCLLNGTPLLSPSEITKAYDAITCEDVQTLAKRIFDWDKLGFSIVGKTSSADEYKSTIYNF